MRYFAADFETTVYAGQTDTVVWSAAITEIGDSTDTVTILKSIREFMNYVESIPDKKIVYFHNLKFDGSFILNYLFTNPKKYSSGFMERQIGESVIRKKPNQKVLLPGQFLYSISCMGQWYTIYLKHKNGSVEFRDSLKLLPYSLKALGKAFETKHQKLDMKYSGFRYPGCDITSEEAEYIKNDVLVLKEALEIMFGYGYNKLTIGACALREFKTMFGVFDYKVMFPDLYTREIDEKVYGARTAGDYIRNAYRGAWCYVSEKHAGVRQGKGFTLDVNSLYPSVMHSESENEYPYGFPEFWHGNFLHPDCGKTGTRYFIRIETSFQLREGYLPCIQVKKDYRYNGREWLKTSDIYKHGEYWCYERHNGKDIPVTVTMTLTQTDFELIKEHYRLYNFKILDGCIFRSDKGFFDEYINTFFKRKQEGKGVMRNIPKLFLNSLYGKFATSTDSSFKTAEEIDGVLHFLPNEEYEKTPGYIAIGAFVTSYAREFTIRSAQANKEIFRYADTDSIHCVGTVENVTGVNIDNEKLLHWKHESNWEEALFIRPKTYLERINGKTEIKCAGLPTRCKHFLSVSFGEEEADENGEYSDRVKSFMEEKRTWDDFTKGLIIPGKLVPKQIRGGVLLSETTFELK